MNRTRKAVLGFVAYLSLFLLTACSGAEPEQPNMEQLAVIIEAAAPRALKLQDAEILQNVPSQEEGGNWRQLRVRAVLVLQEDFAKPVREYPSGAILKKTHNKGDTFTKVLELLAQRHAHGWDMRTTRATWREVSGQPLSSYGGKNVAMEGTEEAIAILAEHERQIAALKQQAAAKTAAVSAASKKVKPKTVAAKKVAPEPTKTADPAPKITGAYIAEQMYRRQDGDAVSRKLSMELVDQRGKRRKRTASVFRRTLKGKKETRISFNKPRSVKGMSFLTHDYQAADQDDEQWLYLPAMKKVRRIPSSDRGDYFLGTDFTYNDVKDELKFEPTDYEFEYLTSVEENGKTLHKISGQPVSEEIAKELGYGGVVALVSAESWMPIDIVFSDLSGAPLKHVEVSQVERLDGIWTARQLVAKNLQSGHQTIFTYSDISYSEQLENKLFTLRSLKK